MGIKSRLGMLAVTIAAIGVLAASPAMAAVGDEASGVISATSTPPPAAVGTQMKLNEIPIASLRDQITNALIARGAASSVDTIEVSYSPFTDNSAGGVTTFALPTGCGQASVALKQGMVIWNQVFTSCTGKSWSDLDYNLEIIRVNPFVHTDTKTVKLSFQDMPAGSSASWDQTVTCPNSNYTSWLGRTQGIMVLGGNKYTAMTTDSIEKVYCGWHS